MRAKEYDDHRRRLGPGWRAARRLGEWERAHAYTQRELAERLGVRQPSVSRMLAGLSPMSAQLYDRAASLMGIDVGTLIGREDPNMWSPRENETIAALHDMAPEDRQHIMELLDVQIEQVQRRKQAARRAEAEDAGKEPTKNGRR